MEFVAGDSVGESILGGWRLGAEIVMRGAKVQSRCFETMAMRSTGSIYHTEYLVEWSVRKPWEFRVCIWWFLPPKAALQECSCVRAS
jgi:hypothetical protein